MATQKQVKALNKILGAALLDQPFFSGIGITFADDKQDGYCTYILLSRELKPHELEMISQLVPPEYKGVQIVTRVVGKIVPL
jgi:hypothetical protein